MQSTMMVRARAGLGAGIGSDLGVLSRVKARRAGDAPNYCKSPLGGRKPKALQLFKFECEGCYSAVDVNIVAIITCSSAGDDRTEQKRVIDTAIQGLC